MHISNSQLNAISSRAFNHAPSQAKQMANTGPVFITDRGQAAHVLLSIKHYERIMQAQPTLAALLGMEVEVDFEPARMAGTGFVAAQFD